MFGYGEYKYDVNNIVQFERGGQAFTVTWRGQVKEYDFKYKTWRRANVYRVDDAFWDCYHESQLHSAWRW